MAGFNRGWHNLDAVELRLHHLSLQEVSLIHNLRGQAQPNIGVSGSHHLQQQPCSLRTSLPTNIKLSGNAAKMTVIFRAFFTPFERKMTSLLNYYTTAMKWKLNYDLT